MLNINLNLENIENGANANATGKIFIDDCQSVAETRKKLKKSIEKITNILVDGISKKWLKNQPIVIEDLDL